VTRADGLVASWIGRQSDSWRPQAEILFRAHKQRVVKANAPAPIASAPGDVGKKRACPGSLVFEEPDAGALPTSVPNSVSTPFMALLELNRSPIRQLIILEGMPTYPDEAKLWYDANAKKNPSYKRGPAKHEEMLLQQHTLREGLLLSVFLLLPSTRAFFNMSWEEFRLFVSISSRI
jgi:hypothetical protein